MRDSLHRLMVSNRRKLAMTFALGVVVGAAAAYFLIGRYSVRNFTSWYSLQVLDQVNVAHEIRGGQADALAARIEDSLPQYVTALHEELGAGPEALSALWAVRSYYETQGVEPPAAVAGVLKALPPRETGCDGQRLPKAPCEEG